MSKGDTCFWRHPAHPSAKAALPSPHGGQTDIELHDAHCGLQGLEGFSMRAAMVLPIATVNFKTHCHCKESFRRHVAGHGRSSSPWLRPVSSHMLCVRGLDKSLFSTGPVTQNVFLERESCSFRLFLGLKGPRNGGTVEEAGHPHSLGWDSSGHVLVSIYI